MGSKLMRKLAAAGLSGAGLLQFGGCDPTIRATVEDGIINVSTSFLTSFLQALLQVATEEQTTAMIARLL